jgi:hypothetical protein
MTMVALTSPLRASSAETLGSSAVSGDCLIKTAIFTSFSPRFAYEVQKGMYASL